MIRLFTFPVFTLLLAFLFIRFDYLSEAEKALTGKEIVYPEHLTGAFTGGFGEETCRSCHFDYELNPEGGTLSISRISNKIWAGKTIEIKIMVERKELGAAGFQLSARYEDGSQAGRFMIEGNERIMFSNSVPDSLQYVQHSAEGTKPSDKNKNSWIVQWQAPEKAQRNVIFNIASNAANGDQSEFGDFIFRKKVEAKIIR